MLEREGERKDGTIFPLESAVSEVRLPDRRVFTAIIRDISERKQVEEALRLEEARLEALVKLNDMAEAPFQAVAEFALEEAVKVTKSEIGFLGFLSDDESELTIHTWSKHAMEDCAVIKAPMVFRIAEAGLWGEAVRQRRPIVVNDYPELAEWKKGYPEGYVPVSRFLGIPVFDGERIVAVAAVGNKKDEYLEGDVRQLTLLVSGMWRIAQRRKVQHALRESEERLQAILDNTTTVIYLKDLEGRYILVNRRFEELFRVSREEIVGKTDYDLFPREQADAMRANDETALKSPTPVEFEEIASHDDELHTYFSIKFSLYNGNGAPYAVCGISADITARVRAEEEARRHQAELTHVARLGTMGEMATGLAHELNQPLSAIVNYIQACLERIRAGVADYDDLLEDMERAAAQAERAGEIIEHMRNFVRKRTSKRTTADVNDLMREAAALVRPEARQSGVEVRLELASSLPPVIAESIQIEQVIVNLIRNGLEAMADSEDGAQHLTISTSRSRNGLVECAVQDAGLGLSEETVERMFDPFFTTKAGGMGMGLSISRSIIEGHGGRLWTEPNPGCGARFVFTLPIAEGGFLNDA